MSIKVITANDVNENIQVVGNIRAISFDSLANHEQIMQMATQYVLSYLPSAYITLLRRIFGVVIDTSTLVRDSSGRYELPSVLLGEWRNFAFFEADVGVDSVYYGAPIVDLSGIFDINSREFIASGTFIADIVLGDDQTVSCPLVIKQLVIDECILRYFESLPEYITSPQMFRIYELKRTMHSESLLALRSGKLRVDEWDALRFASRKPNREVNTIRARFW
jgi:hypothetical protein